MATETLRPDGDGDETGIPGDEGGGRPYFDSVDEVSADDYTTYVGGTGRDLYTLPASAGSGTINKITLYFRVEADVSGNRAWGVIKSDSTVTEGVQRTPFADFGQFNFGTYSEDWTTNPADSQAWEWADIDALQIGVRLLGGACTQVYVVVDYTPQTDYPISLSPGLTAGVSIDREVAWDRGLSPGLTVSATVDREVAWDRSMSPGLALAVTILKGWGRAIATSPGLVVSATVNRVLAYDRAVSAGLTAAITVAYAVAWDRALQPALSVAVTIVRNITSTIATTCGLTASATVDREVAWDRASAPGLKASATVDREVAWDRAIQAGLTAAVTVVRTVAWDRAVSAGLTVAIAVVRTVAWGRATTANLAVSIFIRFFTKMKKRIATIGTNRTLGTVGTNREVTTTGENREVEDW